MTKAKPQDEPKQLECFVIGPIGEETSDQRLDADWLLQSIVTPVLTNPPFRYKVVRADKMPKPGMISVQVISSIMDADLIVADLTHHNPNAYYELAIAHLMEKKTIHTVKYGHHDLPFDIQDMRVIVYSRNHPDDLENAKKELHAQAQAIGLASYKPFSPIAITQALRKAINSSDPNEKVMSVIVQLISQLSDRLTSLEQSRSRGRKSLSEVLAEHHQSNLGMLPVSPGGIVPATGMAKGALSDVGEARIPINAPGNYLQNLLLAELLKKGGTQNPNEDFNASVDDSIKPDDGYNIYKK